MFTSLYRVLCCLLVSMLFVLPASAEKNRERPDDIVRLDQVAPDILQELRYTGNDNFTGRPVAGYAHASCLLTNAAAQALKKGIRNPLLKDVYETRLYSMRTSELTVETSCAIIIFKIGMEY